jgi:hypothetical protein
MTVAIRSRRSALVGSVQTHRCVPFSTRMTSASGMCSAAFFGVIRAHVGVGRDDRPRRQLYLFHDLLSR